MWPFETTAGPTRENPTGLPVQGIPGSVENPVRSTRGLKALKLHELGGFARHFCNMQWHCLHPFCLLTAG